MKGSKAVFFIMYNGYSFTQGLTRNNWARNNKWRTKCVSIFVAFGTKTFDWYLYVSMLMIVMKLLRRLNKLATGLFVKVSHYWPFVRRIGLTAVLFSSQRPQTHKLELRNLFSHIKDKMKYTGSNTYHMVDISQSVTTFRYYQFYDYTRCCTLPHKVHWPLSWDPIMGGSVSMIWHYYGDKMDKISIPTSTIGISVRPRTFRTKPTRRRTVDKLLLSVTE